MAMPVRAGARGAADAVDVLLGHVGQVVVDDVRDIVDVDAARGDFGGDENTRLALLEAVERTGALALALVAVDGVGVEAGAFQLLRDAVSAVLGAGEDQRALDRLIGEHRVQEILLLGLIDVDDSLLDALGGGRLRGNRDFATD